MRRNAIRRAVPRSNVQFKSWLNQLSLSHESRRTQQDETVFFLRHDRRLLFLFECSAGFRRSKAYLLSENKAEILSCVSLFNVLPIGSAIQPVVNQRYVISVTSLTGRTCRVVGGRVNFPRVSAVLQFRKAVGLIDCLLEYAAQVSFNHH